MKKYICTICGYISEGNVPEVCPVCKAPSSKFVEQTGGSMAWADEHRIGVAQGVDERIVEGLRLQFEAECQEVGIYLAMARQADRDGLPEVAEAYKRIALEEAEHASKFAELLGEMVDVSTKTNLEKRIVAENAACSSRKELATLAKKLDLDAIHDTVHEICKDEARHGKVFEGLVNRYFKS